MPPLRPLPYLSLLALLAPNPAAKAAPLPPQGPLRCPPGTEPYTGGGLARGLQGCIDKDQKFQGPFRETYADGTTAAAGPLRGRRHGEWNFWNPDGTLRATWVYDDGVVIDARPAIDPKLTPDTGHCDAVLKRIHELQERDSGAGDERRLPSAGSVYDLLAKAQAEADDAILKDCESGKLTPRQRSCVMNALNDSATLQCLRDPTAPTPDEILVQRDKLTQELCACKDAACAEHSLELLRLYNAKMPELVNTPAQYRRAAQLAGRKNDCLRRLAPRPARPKK
jgi:hypothetical protein